MMKRVRTGSVDLSSLLQLKNVGKAAAACIPRCGVKVLQSCCEHALGSLLVRVAGTLTASAAEAAVAGNGCGILQAPTRACFGSGCSTTLGMVAFLTLQALLLA